MNQFLVHACGSILLLRLLILNFFPDNYIYTQERLSDLIVSAAIFITFLILIVHKLKYNLSFPRSPFDLPIGLLLAAMILSLNGSADFSVSINAFIPFLSGVLLFYIVVDLLKNEKSALTLWSYLQCCVLVVVFFGIWEYIKIDNPIYGATFRIGSVFQWPNVLAGFLMLLLPLFWAALSLIKDIWQRRIVLITLILSTVTFLLTFSFLCTINLVLATLILSPLILNNSLKNFFLKKSYLIIGFSVVAILVTILMIRQDFSVDARMEYLKTAFLLIKDNPWSGFGLNSFDLVNRQYVSYKLGYSAYVHNSYLQLWLETGILGLLAVITLIKTFIKTSCQSIAQQHNPTLRLLLIALIWSITAFLIDNLTNFTLLRPSIYLFAWVILAGFCVLVGRDTQTTSSHKLAISNKTILVLLGLIISSALLLTIQMSLGLWQYNQGVNTLEKSQRSYAYQHFQKAYQLDPTEFRYPYAIGSLYIQDYMFSQNKKFLNIAKDYFYQAKDLSPYSVKTYEILSKIELKQENWKESQAYLSKAKRLSPLKYSRE